MSRIEAALRRATTGEVEPAPKPSPDLGLVRGDRGYGPQGPVGAEAEPEVDETLPHVIFDGGPAVSSPAGSVADPEPEVRFTSFHPDYAEKLVASDLMSPLLREQYRRLAATLHHAQAESGIRVLMIASAVPDEGKTLTALNIALTLSESYQRKVLLVDADLRRPSMAKIFQAPNVFGLNEVLTSGPERKVPLIQITQHLSLLPAGTPNPDPMSPLTSERMQRLLTEAAASFEWVIIDTPPVGILTDAKLLGAMVDGALLVVRAEKTPAQLIQRAVTALGRERILGIVLNRADETYTTGGNSYYSSYYYSANTQKIKRV